MIKIGITGGIGSGKSTVCEVWESLGAFVVNADDLAKQIMVSNEDVRREIIEAFGEDSYQPDGSLNREHLVGQAFAGGRVKELNTIVHPRIPAELASLAKEAQKKGKEALVYEAALLLQNGRPEGMDKIVLVLAYWAQRLERVKKRDGVKEKPVLERMEKQQDFEQLKHLADFVIVNNGKLSDLEKRASEVYKTIVSGCKK